jgi:hypothetical protein
MNDLTPDEQLLADLGVEAEEKTKSTNSPRELRILTGFEEIEKFFEENKHIPQHGESNDIFERIYAVRLDRIRSSVECLNLLKDRDRFGLLKGYELVNIGNETEESDESDEDLLADLGVSPDDDSDITNLKHVRTRSEIKMAEEFAKRAPCPDFDKFKPLFEEVQNDLKSKKRETHSFKKNNSVELGDLFILGGQIVYVADMGEVYIADYGMENRKLLVIYDNGTESDILLNSFVRGLYKDPSSRRIVDPSKIGPLFSGIVDESDTTSGTIYVLRSKSDHPYVSKNRDVIHKIGVTKNRVEKRIFNAELDPTYLMSEVDVVATYELANINRAKLENLIHKFFKSAQLKIEIKDRFGSPVVPKEWFLVPLFIIDEAVERIKNGSIVNCDYDPKIGKIVERSSQKAVKKKS